jgi:hypothetical protein
MLDRWHEQKKPERGGHGPLVHETPMGAVT